MDEWHFDGTAGEFIGTVKWALLARQMEIDQLPERFDVIRTPDLVFQKADEYGMTSDAITKEMIRIGREAQQTYKLQRDIMDLQDSLKELRAKGLI
jgi:hypothetical protein